MTLYKTCVFLLLVQTVSWTLSEEDNKAKVSRTEVYQRIHKNYDDLGDKDGYVSYHEIKRALGGTQQDEWNKEIEPHDDGDQLLTATELENWLTSFKKDEF